MNPEQMSFLEPDLPKTWSVSEVNAYLRDLLESDYNLQDLWVQGEVSNLARPRSGHVYFTLKDAQASLRCVMWKNVAARYQEHLREGDAVEAHGNVSVYERSGQYQLYVDFVRPRGEGALYQQFLMLKEKLQNEGLFEAEHKQPLPPWPKRIGIITSPTGAALQDMLNTLRRRYPLADVVLVPATVQGENAPPTLVDALTALNQREDVDLILIGRGGGSIEDLWAFNDERVARAVFDSRIPVISGVGHETDYTITDFVADLRAPTPTAAAELAVPDQEELRGALGEYRNRLLLEVQEIIRDGRWTLTHLEARLARVSPDAAIQMGRQQVDEYAARLVRETARGLQERRTELDYYLGRLQTLDPATTLARGYAIVTREDGVRVRSVKQVEGGDPLTIQVTDGEVDAQVTDQA
jgi:exodeoxyribonuclease VII large subunit